MESKSVRALTIAVVVLVAGLGACVLKISELEKKIEQIGRGYASEISMLRTDMNNIYANVDTQMKRQASILARLDWECGAVDPGNLALPFELSVIPKTVSDETRVSVEVAGQSIELDREGDLFSGRIAVPLSFRGEGRLVVTVIEGDLRTTEIVEGVDVSLICSEYLPILYVDDATRGAHLKNGEAIFDGEFFIYYERMKDESADFVEAEVLVSINGSQIDRIDAADYITDVTHGGGDWVYLPFDKRYPMSDGDELVITVIAVDSFGFTHAIEAAAYAVDGNELSRNVNGGSEQVWAAPGESSYMGEA